MILINDLSGNCSPVGVKCIKCKCSTTFRLPDFVENGQRYRINEQGSIYVSCPKCKQVYTYTFKEPFRPHEDNSAEVAVCPDDGVFRIIGCGALKSVKPENPVMNMTDLELVDFSNDGVTIVDGRLIINYNGGRQYDFDFDRIKDEASLVRWLHHLSGKVWFSKYLASELIEVVCKAKGFRLYGGD